MFSFCRRQHDSAKYYIIKSIYISSKNEKVILPLIHHVLLGVQMGE